MSVSYDGVPAPAKTETGEKSSERGNAQQKKKSAHSNLIFVYNDVILMLMAKGNTRKTLVRSIALLFPSFSLSFGHKLECFTLLVAHIQT